MKKGILLGFLVLLTLDTLAQVAMKLVADKAGDATSLATWLQHLFAQPLLYAIAGLYAVSFTTYVTLLKHAPVGPAYAAAHGHIVTVTIVSVLFLGERLTLLQAGGAAAIVAGIVLLAITEKPETPDLAATKSEAAAEADQRQNV